MILSVKDLSFDYPRRSVLKNISFSVARGDLLAILGVNGAGKSTLLKCINGILKPATGTIYVKGDKVSGLGGRERAKRIGYVPQHQTGNGMTVFDAVLLGRKPYIKWETTQGDLEMVAAALKSLDMQEYAFRCFDKLSGGEQQKVMLARAIAQKPDLLLLDEPTSNLDLKSQIETMKSIKKLVARSNIAAVATMHDINLALRFANKFLLLKDGRNYAGGGSEVITSKNIENVYSVRVKVDKFEDVMLVIPV